MGIVDENTGNVTIKEGITIPAKGIQEINKILLENKEEKIMANKKISYTVRDFQSIRTELINFTKMKNLKSLRNNFETQQDSSSSDDSIEEEADEEDLDNDIIEF